MTRRPDRILYSTESEYRRHYEAVYCSGPIETFDGIAVRFKKSNFDHAFFESVTEEDDTFSPARAERVDWIRWALQNPRAELYAGWDKKKKRADKQRRVAVVNGDYVVIIRLVGRSKAVFVTAFVAGSRTLTNIRLGDSW